MPHIDGRLLFVAVLGFALYLLIERPAPEAPNVTLNPVRGETVQLRSLRGKPVLLNFSSSTCGPCLRDLPKLEKFRETDEAAAGLAMYGIFPWDNRQILFGLARKKRVGFPLVEDRRHSLLSAFGGIRATPSYVLISPGGRIAWKHTGAMNFRALREQLAAM